MMRASLSLPAVYHLARADLLERIRRSSFLIVLVSAVFVGFLSVPPIGAGYRVLQVGTQRGVYDSAWIGLMFGLIAALHLPLVGFYLVRNAVDRDRQTGVGEILATTPISKPAYVLGKWLSNVSVLVLILAVMTLMAGVMQLVRAEDTAIRLGALVPNIWLMSVPVLAVAAALAVLFECTPVLRSSWGNVIYLFLWLFSIALVLGGSMNSEAGPGVVRPKADLYSFSRPVATIQQQLLAVDPEADVSSGLAIIGPDIEGTFVWTGFRWTAGIVLERLRWLGLALLLALAAAIPFDRFDPARARRRTEATAIQADDEPVSAAAVPVGGAIRLAPLSASPRRWAFPGLLAAELKLVLRGQKPLWYLGAIALNLACLFNPSTPVQRYLLLAVWLWPLALWSRMGVRERRFNTEQLVFSAQRPVLRQLPATWLAAVLVTVLAGFGAWLHLALAGEAVSVVGWFAGALFVPALALALGTWTGSSRAFEAGYLLLWYLGAFEGIPVLDFTGTSAADGEIWMPIVYVALAGGLVLLAMIGRHRRLRA
jgi:ABC-type transport system involved in multi-copper enzyme maturation permease subunit